jgi:2-polyprenyl-3-methyl-5-hydroxy-6-metoxy-1,4-benzoquinol methylase
MTVDGTGVADRAEVERFLAGTKMEAYQRIELPHGLATPGRDRSHSVTEVFRHPVAGKSLLDVGCKHGYFCHEALRRGATRVKGIDIEAENVAITREIARLWNRPIEAELVDFLALPEEPFDVVLFLNVLHHVLDPVAALRKLAALSRERLVIEFATPFDHQAGFGPIARRLLRPLLESHSLVHLGERSYHRAWYFSGTALERLLVQHLELFRRVELHRSPQWRGRLLAHCWK